MEGYGECHSDYVEVFDGPSASSPMLLKICGLDVPPSIQSRHNTMAVRFVTDDVYQDKGFTARFERANCGGYLRANEGTFASPGYPVEYPPNSKCTWRIEIPVGFSVILSFDSFKVENKGDCVHDHIEIYDGPSEHSPSLRRICGSEIPAPVLSTSNTMTVRFVSDHDSQEQGFTARFKMAPLAKLDSCATVDHDCGHFCVNIPGSYMCRCIEGYTLLPDGKTCTRIPNRQYFLGNLGPNRADDQDRVKSPIAQCSMGFSRLVMSKGVNRHLVDVLRIYTATALRHTANNRKP
nr:unnamed protein product [Spirometra erinaceieuropaei]